MIPLRIHLDGFMSYREPATVSFDGAPLWALVGPNGAGKSALFDAITFVLYGACRGGKQHHEDLINHQADRLMVELDFRLGEEVFRVKRTVARRGPASYQAWHLTRGGDGQEQWLVEPSTDSRAGLDRWVERTIGLKDDTFTASVLLQQGKADALLEADPSVRHRMLSQLLNLSVYERLHELARGRHGEANTEARVYGGRLQATPEVSDEEIAQLTQQAASALGDAETARQRQRQLAALVVQAAEWGRQAARRRELEEQLAKAQELLANADDIERDAARLSELIAVVPGLRSLLAERERLDDCRRQRAEHQAHAQRWSEQLAQAQAQLDMAAADVARLEAQQAMLKDQRNGALRTLADLAPDVEALVTLERDRSQLAELDRVLASYPPDLDDQLAAQERTVQALQELQATLPWLEQYAGARADWREAAAQAGAALDRGGALGQEITAAEAEQKGCSSELATARSGDKDWRERAAAAKALYDEAKAHLRRFHQIEGKPDCPYCGSELTAEHLEAERERVLAEVAEKEQHYKEAQRAFSEADTVVKQLEKDMQALGDKLIALHQHQRTQQEAERLARLRQGQAEKQAQAALAALPSTYAARIRPDAAVVRSTCFASAYPTAGELAALAQSLAALAAAEQRLTSLRAKARERHDRRVERQPLAERVARGEQRYPAERTRRIRAEHAAAKDAEKATEAALSGVETDVEEARQRRGAAQAVVDKEGAAQEQATHDANAEEVREGELERGIALRLADLPEPWQERGAAGSRAELAALGQEQKALGGADRRAAALVDARRDHALLQQSLRDVQEALSHVPEEARRPKAELDAEDRRVSAREQEADRARQEAETRRQTLESRREQRQEWAEQRRKVAHQAYLYGELERLLGRDNLQRHLLHQAEVGIVGHANDILDHISAGALQLELRSDNSTGEGSKALDLVAYNRQTGQQPLHVKLLSGSQRFRVAVSLAIGIGRYAGEGARRMESVIIDEGFGSLDRDGLREMSDELHRLGNALGRIILVSHQEEFASGFRHKYEIRLEDGSSRAVLVD